MENTPKVNELSSVNFRPFYKRPDGIARSLTEVSVLPNESNDEFIARARDELAEQYPNSSVDDQIRMAKKILETERQRMPGYQRSQQEHEMSADERYRKELKRLHEQYEMANSAFKMLKDSGRSTDEEIQDMKLNSQIQLLEERREAFLKYEKDYHDG